MSITALAFLALYFSGLVMAVFRHPRYGLYAYLFAFYMHPPDRWWSSDVPDLRWALIAGIVTLVMLVRHDSEQQRQSWLQTGAGKLLLWYLAWMVLQTLWSITGDLHIEGLELFAKYVVLFYLIYRLVDSETEFRNFFIIHMLGCFYLGWLAFGKTISGRLEGMGGPGIGDANTFGTHVSTAAFFAAALLLRGGRYIRLMVIATIPFILNAMILTQSRGAFLGLVAGGIAILALKPPQLRKSVFFGLGSLAVVLFLMLSPPEFIERLQSIVSTASKEERDSSANTRLALAEAQLKIAKKHPFGAGHRGTRVLSMNYLDEEFLTANRHGEGLARSSHNTYLAVLVDQGLPGLLLYGLLILWIVRSLWMIRSLDDKGLPFELACYRMALGGALALVLAAGIFSNYFKAEVMIWCIALLASLRELSLRVTVEATDQPPADVDESTTLRPQPQNPAWQ
jgi:O-antigen ligase